MIGLSSRLTGLIYLGPYVKWQLIYQYLIYKLNRVHKAILQYFSTTKVSTAAVSMNSSSTTIINYDNDTATVHNFRAPANPELEVRLFHSLSHPPNHHAYSESHYQRQGKLTATLLTFLLSYLSTTINTIDHWN